jgi:hypothetical protein
MFELHMIISERKPDTCPKKKPKEFVYLHITKQR